MCARSAIFAANDTFCQDCFLQPSSSIISQLLGKKVSFLKKKENLLRFSFLSSDFLCNTSWTNFRVVNLPVIPFLGKKLTSS